MHIQRLFQIAIFDPDFIAKPSFSGDGAGHPMEAREKAAMLHPGIDFQGDFIPFRIVLEKLAQGDLAPFPVMPLELMAGLALLGADAFDHFLRSWGVDL